MGKKNNAWLVQALDIMAGLQTDGHCPDAISGLHAERSANVGVLKLVGAPQMGCFLGFRSKPSSTRHLHVISGK